MARIAIVGAGPAGSSAAWHLARRGHQVDLIDRARFPRPKTCGDWIPLNALEELDALGLGGRALEFAATEYAPIARTTLAAPDGRASRSDGRARALCIPRVVFDAILWRHAVDAGCRPVQESVRNVRSLRRDYELIVDARGAHGGTPNAVALRGYWTVPRSVLDPGDEETVQIHTDGTFTRGYGWMFPVAQDAGAVRMNIGVGLWAADSVPGHSIADFHERFVTTNPVLLRWRSQATIARPVGCHVGLGGDRNQVADAEGVFRIGDAANLADPLTGDGIANAIRSGRLVAAAIDGAADVPQAAAAWQAAHDRVFVPEFRRARRLQRALVRTAAKNGAAMVLAMSPWARRRVHAALFGEAPYRALTQPWRRLPAGL